MRLIKCREKFAELTIIIFVRFCHERNLKTSTLKTGNIKPAVFGDLNAFCVILLVLHFTSFFSFLKIT